MSIYAALRQNAATLCAAGAVLSAVGCKSGPDIKPFDFDVCSHPAKAVTVSGSPFQFKGEMGAEKDSLGLSTAIVEIEHAGKVTQCTLGGGDISPWILNLGEAFRAAPDQEIRNRLVESSKVLQAAGKAIHEKNEEIFAPQERAIDQWMCKQLGGKNCDKLNP